MANHHDPQFYAALLHEQSQKKSAFDYQLELEFKQAANNPIEEQHRQEYLKFLAARILHIDNLLDLWLDSVELDIDRLS